VIGDFLRQNLTLRRVSGNGLDGEQTHATPGTAIYGRMEFGHRIVTSSAGETLSASARVFLLPSQDVSPGDLIVFANSTYRVQRVDLSHGLLGLDHKVAYVNG
jgi:hypothetical protein